MILPEMLNIVYMINLIIQWFPELAIVERIFEFYIWTNKLSKTPRETIFKIDYITMFDTESIILLSSI